jgi:sialate O-acetylesterase
MLQRIAVRLAWAGLAATMLNSAHAEARLLDPLFSDHAVLQRDRPLEVWGRAPAGDTITVTLGTATQTARADAQGRWALKLPALPAGGPFTLSARTDTAADNATDVMIGDVWLCSGQSNMEWAVRNTLNAGAEVASSANERIRQLTIVRNNSAAPLAQFAAPLEWRVAGPATTEHFSAACYYFVRELLKTVDAPQGIISSNWGGSRIEPWMSDAGLRAIDGHQESLELLGEYRTNRAVAFWHWGEIWQKWWLAQPLAQNQKPWAANYRNGGWQRAPEPLDYWEHWNVPALANYDGLVWFRAHVRLTKAQAQQPAKLSMGSVDDVDVTWVNGRAVGNSSGLDARVYDLPAKLLKAGDNLVVVNVHDFWGDGGLFGPGEQRALLLADGTRVPVTGWEYQVAPKVGWPPAAPWEPLNGVNVLYNAMIAPLGNYGLRGVAWYQGEANAGLGDALEYQALLQGLFADWRKQFQSPLPFLVVQLANYGKLADSNVDSGWARLRDAQRRAVAADGNAGLAVTIDIGNRDDIHPANKQDVGKRLAQAARRVVYGEKVSASGAQAKTARRSAGGIDVTLGDFDGKLLVVGSKDPAGFELCGATQDTCRFVRAQLREGGAVRLEDAAAADAQRVRFCWADSPLCNLYDSTGLPVGPFELPLQ